MATVKKVEIKPEFIIEAYNAACSDWKSKIIDEIGMPWHQFILENASRPRNPMKGDFLSLDGMIIIVDEVAHDFKWDRNYQIKPLDFGNSRNISNDLTHGSHGARFATADEIKKYLSKLHNNATVLTVKG